MQIDDNGIPIAEPTPIFPVACSDQMRAILESAAREYHEKGGNVADDFFAGGADSLVRLCHPEFFTIDGVDWAEREVASLVGELLEAQHSCRYGPLMQKAARVLAAMGEHVFSNSLASPETKNFKS